MINWTGLGTLREQFLSTPNGTIGDYWSSRELVQDYDETFAERIGWKWDSVLEEASPLLPRLHSINPNVVDWGCGTGIATRRFLKYLGAESCPHVTLIERSQLALRFATQKIQEAAPSVRIGLPADSSHPFVLLISHVLGELSPEIPSDLEGLLNRATATFWVEPGTPDMSRRLIAIRERLRDRFHFFAPCPHQSTCGLLQPGNEVHWCHHFAKVPLIAFQSAMWNRLSRELGIDLRSLPISYWVIIRKDLFDKETNPPTNRIVGRARLYKGYLKVLVCENEGVQEKRLLERGAKPQFKRLKRGGFRLSYL